MSKNNACIRNPVCTVATDVRGLLTVVLACVALTSAGHLAASSVAQPPRSREEITARGRVAEVHSSRLFTMAGNVAGESEVLVVPPRPVSVSLVGSEVEVRGALRRFDSAELGATWNDIDETTRRMFSGRRVLVAVSLIATAPGETRQITEETERPGETTSAAATAPTYALPVGQPTLDVMPATLTGFIGEFAGQHVSVRHARVVGVFAPDAFLIEPATRYQMMMDYRDRILVLVDDARLTVSPDAIVSATVSVEGIARTLADMRLTAGTQWPGKLTPELVKRLEVRAAILARSVRTPDGTELTGRPVASR